MNKYNRFYEIIGSAIAKKEKIWGFHVICDATNCDESTVNSAEIVKTFIETTIRRIEMIPVGEPIHYYFNDGDGRGVSVIQLLTTSHCSAHTDDSKLSAYIDIFSCNSYDEKKVDTVVETIKEFFNPKDMAVKVILREPAKITASPGESK